MICIKMQLYCIQYSLVIVDDFFLPSARSLTTRDYILIEKLQKQKIADHVAVFTKYLSPRLIYVRKIP